jgi:ribonuclease HI
MQTRIKIYSDGGARGNPGPAAAAYLILAENGAVIKAESRYLGKRTNNQAEYEALIAALRAAAELGAKEVVCHLDSQLVCKHLTGAYKVKNPELLKLWTETQELKTLLQRNPIYQRTSHPQIYSGSGFVGEQKT